MLGFIVPLRARALARDWDRHVWLLRRTLRSILAQTDSDFRVFLVCHDVPAIPEVAGPVRAIEVDLPLPRRTFDDMCVDKVIKLTRGVERAIAEGCRHVMYVDADDLVSRRLSAFVKNHPHGNGWYFANGYAYRYGERWLSRQSRHNEICGTSNIVRADLLRFGADPAYRHERVETLAAAGHALFPALLEKNRTPLAPLPFPGSVYVRHTDNISGLNESGGPVTPRWRARLGQIRRMPGRIARLRPLSRSVQREFGLPGAGEVSRHSACN